MDAHERQLYADVISILPDAIAYVTGRGSNAVASVLALGEVCAGRMTARERDLVLERAEQAAALASRRPGSRRRDDAARGWERLVGVLQRGISTGGRLERTGRHVFFACKWAIWYALEDPAADASAAPEPIERLAAAYVGPPTGCG